MPSSILPSDCATPAVPGWLPANLIQAQRDHLGAHTYEQVDTKGAFHTQREKELKGQAMATSNRPSFDRCRTNPSTLFENENEPS